MNRDQRRQVEADFKQNEDVCILVATDAAGEGINLQTAHLLINYDLPWNPNRIEQRFGRIHRIGQKHTCYMYNLVADGTREGGVWHRLFDKLEQQRQTLGGRVFDVLGQVTYDDKSLHDLLLDAVLEDQTPERQSYLDRVLDSSLDTERLRRIMRTEMGNRTIASGSNALASSIVLVCRRRPASAPTATRPEFQRELRRSFKGDVERLQSGSVAPVDMVE